MVPLSSLWIPILLSAVIVFVASSIVHMVLRYHNSDYPQLPQQDQVMDALRPFSISPGQYMVPRAESMADMKNPEFKQKMERGPVFMINVFRPGDWAMGSRLGQWFIFSIVVSIFAAYVAGRTLPPGTDYLQVMRIVGTVTFAGYALGHVPNSIWYNLRWSTTFKNMFDGLIYGLLTGGTFGWLWPAM
jgi:hypothetical protein